MGVPQWYSRFALVGAAKSLKFCAGSLHSEEPKVKISTPETLLSTIELAAASVSEKDFSAEERVSSGKPTIPLDLDVVIEAKTTAAIKYGLIPQISLRLFLSDTHIVISEAGEDVSHIEEQSFLQNLLKTVRQDGAGLKFQESFSWPVFKSLKVLNGNELAHEVLLDQWLSSFNPSQYRVFMYFGQQNNELIRKLTENNALIESQFGLIFFHDSIPDLLRMPMRKADVWKTLLTNIEKFPLGGSK